MVPVDVVCSVVAWVDVCVLFVQRHDVDGVSFIFRAVPNKRLIFECCADVDGSTTALADRIAADDVVYGVARTWPPTIGFGTFGDQTAHGNSPTKRSPTDGLASGCVCELILTRIFSSGTINFYAFLNAFCVSVRGCVLYM